MLVSSFEVCDVVSTYNLESLDIELNRSQAPCHWAIRPFVLVVDGETLNYIVYTNSFPVKCSAFNGTGRFAGRKLGKNSLCGGAAGTAGEGHSRILDAGPGYTPYPCMTVINGKIAELLL